MSNKVRKDANGLMEILTAKGWEPLNGDTMYKGLEFGNEPELCPNCNTYGCTSLSCRIDHADIDWREVEAPKDRTVRTKLY